MWTPTLDDVINAPRDPDDLRMHLQSVGALPTDLRPAALASPPIQQLVPPNIPPSGPSVPLRPPTRMDTAMKTSELAEPSGTMTPPIVSSPDAISSGGPVKPMTAPTLTGGPGAFPGMESSSGLPMGTPGTAQGGMLPFYQSQFDRAAAANRHDSMSDHPSFLGKVGHVLGRVGNVALNAFVPGLAETIPGTDAYKVATEQRAKRELAGEQERESKEKQRTAETAEAEARAKKLGQENEDLITDKAGNLVGWKDAKGNHSLEDPSTPQAIKDMAKVWQGTQQGKEERWTELKDFTGPNGEPMEIEEHSGQIRAADKSVGAQAKPAKAEKQNDFEQYYSAYLKDNKLPDTAKNRLQARKDYEKAGQKEPETTGTWALDEDADGNPILFNSKTGATRPAPTGLQKSGTKAKKDAALEKEIGPARDAQQYAMDYLKRGVFTGAGDEALQEKFFELAKPTTGFRMTQPQIDMLQHSREWMGSAEAYLRHSTAGTWFSDKQRHEIVNTMNDLAAAKMKGVQAAHGGAGGGAGGKIATPELLDAYAKAHNVTRQQAEEAARKSGYEIK